jgi:hypothetical protein
MRKQSGKKRQTQENLQQKSGLTRNATKWTKKERHPSFNVTFDSLINEISLHINLTEVTEDAPTGLILRIFRTFVSEFICHPVDGVLSLFTMSHSSSNHSFAAGFLVFVVSFRTASSIRFHLSSKLSDSGSDAPDGACSHRSDARLRNVSAAVAAFCLPCLFCTSIKACGLNLCLYTSPRLYVDEIREVLTVDQAVIDLFGDAGAAAWRVPGFEVDLFVHEVCAPSVCQQDTKVSKDAEQHKKFLNFGLKLSFMLNFRHIGWGFVRKNLYVFQKFDVFHTLYSN